MTVRIEGTDELQKIADALKAAADRELQKRVSAAMRDLAKPLGRRVLEKGAEELPQRGGFAAYFVARGRVNVSNSLRGRSASVTIALRNKGTRFAAVDKGLLRHPVFARGDKTRKEQTWVSQRIRPGVFTRAYEAEVPNVRAEVLKAAQATLTDVARKA